MNNVYFTDREHGPLPRNKETIEGGAWGGIVSIIQTLIDNGSFGCAFPYTCPDGSVSIGTDKRSMSLAVKAEIPDITRLTERSGWDDQNIPILTWLLNANEIPPTHTILDLIEFCHRHVAKPMQGKWHPFFNHYHLNFVKEEGQLELRRNINLIFSRNGLAFELQENGQIIRLAPPIIREVLKTATFQTGDKELNFMLETARTKYLNPDLQMRKESLEKLWDAWERIKTILPGKDKKEGIKLLIEKAAPEGHFRKILEAEATQLTNIGNDFQIRHSETNKTPVEINEHVDYLFHHLFALINLLLQSLSNKK